MSFSMPAFFHPCTVVLVDDNARYLRGLRNGLAGHYHYEIFSQANLAKNYFDEVRDSGDTSSSLLSLEESDEYDEDALQVIRLDLEEYYKGIIASSNRFKQNAVLIIDYAMPQIDGVTFCEYIKDLPFKKLMLTGAADSEIAVKAFNKGVIDKFIIKKDLDSLLVDLKKTVYDLQYQYYTELTSQVIANLALEGQRCYMDPNFANYFESVCQDNNIVEFYLLDKCGSYLLLEADGKASILAVKALEDIQEYIDLVNHAENIPKHVADQIISYNSFPLFLSQQDYNTPFSQWEKYLHPANCLEGENNKYYVSLISDVQHYQLGLENMISFQDFQRQA